MLTAGLVKERHMDYSCVLSAWQVFSHAFTTCQWLLVSIKHTTGFTHEYLPLVSYHSRVQKCTTGVTHKYFQLVSNRSWAVYFSCRMQCTSCSWVVYFSCHVLLVYCRFIEETQGLLWGRRYLIIWTPLLQIEWVTASPLLTHNVF